MAERYAPPSPVKLPAYKLPTLEAQRPPSPPSGQELFQGDLIAPMGCELSVHNVHPTESLPTSADVVNHALLVIHKSNPDLTPVHATFKLKDTPTLCSIKLRGDVAVLDAKPRPDLLEPWISLLRSHNPEWEVDWACAPPNRDKRLWVVLKGVDGSIDKGTVDVARSELQRAGFRSVGGFVMTSSGSVVVNMASLQLARTLQNRKSLKIPKLSKHPLIVDRFPCVQPEWAFELIITGLDNYDVSVKMVLDDYFSKNYIEDGQTLWYRSRIVDDAYYCFMMKNWDATLQVLQDKDKFEARCSSTLPNLGFPRQIYEVNTAGGFHESIARKLKMAGASVSGSLSDVQTQIQNLRRDMDRGFNHMDKRIESQQKDLHALTNSVSTLNDRIQNQSYALLALQNSSVVQERKTAIDAAMMHKSIMYNMLSEEEKIQARTEVRNLELMKKEVEKELEDLRAAARGYAAPSLLPPTESHRPSQAMPPQFTQQQVPPFASRPPPATEPAPQKHATRSSQMSTQKSQNTTNRVVSAKKRKTMESVSSSEAPLNLEDSEMVPESQGQ